MTSHALVGCTDSQGEVGLVDCWRHIGAGVDEGTAEVIGGGRDIVRTLSTLALGLGSHKARFGVVVAGGTLGVFFEFCLGSLFLVGKEERAGRDGTRASLELA